MDHKVRKLRKLLEDAAPEHDTAVGLVHPYWARKPLNIVEIVINALSSKGDIVIDPFMGSGTTLFAALKNDKMAIGGDINPLSVFLVKAILEIAKNGEEIVPEIEQILSKHRELSLEWFKVGNDEYIERARYNVDGVFSEGNFKLTLVEAVTKNPKGNKWTGRKAYPPHDLREIKDRSALFKPYISHPVDFNRITLTPNSRIAIPKGATLGHYFTKENQASINLLISLIRKSRLYKEYPEALMLIVSSALPLLRLSDKKASSQWPYWRPKHNLTSRNPTMVFEGRLLAIKELAVWAKTNLSYLNRESILPGGTLNIFNCSAQRIGKELGDIEADLLFTDPPYGDQVPYIEYSSLWLGILGLDIKSDAYREEVVKTDAVGRKDDTADYHNRLASTFLSNSQIVKQNGYLVWFYQDQDLTCWQTINNAAKKAGVRLIDVIPLPKQRRSLKTVTSPNTTLDGDLLCIFKKLRATRSESITVPSLEELKKELRNGDSYFAKYSKLITYSLKYDLIDIMASQYKTVKSAISALSE